MTYRVVQRGAQPLIVLFLVGAHLDEELRRVLPGVAIVATDQAPLHPTLFEPFNAYGAPASDACVLVGYSAGCQPVRAHLLNGVHPTAVVTIDGTHATKPPEPWQLDVWRELAGEARRGERIWVATCTQQLYVERLPRVQAFTATRHVLEAAVGQELRAGTQVNDGDLHVISYASHDIDADAHIAQQRVVLPEMLRRYIAPLYTDGAATEPPPADSSPTQPQPWRDYRVSFGERLVAWYRAEQAAGVREVPPGSNTGPRVRQYLEICRRRGTEKPLGLTAGAWCCAMACYGCDAVALPGEPYPAPRAAGIELEQDARETGDWHDVAEVLAGGWAPEVGDLVVCARGAPSWQRHVCALVHRDGEVLTTIGGNEGNEIRETVRQMRGGAEPLLGFVALMRR